MIPVILTITGIFYLICNNIMVIINQKKLIFLKDF